MHRIDNGLCFEDEAPAVGDEREYRRLMAEMAAARAEWTARIGDRVGNPTDRDTAAAAAVEAARRGHLDVALLRRETPEGAWVEQPFATLASRLVPVKVRPFSVVRGRH